MTIKILHIITDLDVGGAEMVLYRLLSRMEKARFESQVVSLIQAGPVGEKIQALGFPVRSLGMHAGWPSQASLLHLMRLLRIERPDIIQTWLYHADLEGLLVARMTKMPCVVWNLRASDTDMSQYRWLSGLVQKVCARLSRWPQAVVVNSVAGQDYHTRLGYRPRRWALIPNGVDINQFSPAPQVRLTLRQELGLEPRALLIGLIARYDPMKDHVNFLQAAGALIRSGAEAHFVLVGEGVVVDNSDLSGLIAQENLLGRIHLLGRRDDISTLTAALDIASSSSYGEGFPNTIAEAMACGVPCVVTDAGDSAYLVGETGIVVPLRNPQALANGWLRLIGMGAEGRRRLGEAARERICLKFSLEKMVAQYENLYLSLLDIS